jgi:putative endonuclease
MAAHNELGKQGEERAAAYLASRGYEILERNWRCGHLELDLICRREDFLVMVEVKTRRTKEEYPDELLNRKKRKNLLTAANAYAKGKGIQTEIRFDLILITGEEIEHIQEAITIFD